MFSFVRKHHRAAAAAAMLGAVVCASAAQAQSPVRFATVRPHGAAIRQSVSPFARALNAAKVARASQFLRGAAPDVTKTLNSPYGITVDINSNVYVTNIFGGVNVYNSARKKIAAFTAGTYPAAVATSFNGDIYVANHGSNNVTIYDPAYAQIGTISDSTLVSPQSMYIDANDTVWVLDAGGTLHAYLNDGTTLASTHTGGTTVGPWGPNVTVWGIADLSGGYVEAYENVAQAVQSGPNLDTFFPSSQYAGEAQDQYAQQYVSDLLNDQIEIWSRTGQYEVGQINTPAPPYGVAVDPNLHRLYVVLTTSNIVDVYSTIAPYKLLGTIN